GCRSRAMSYVSYLFFFQAEDGIRDFHVTGVQTCALPIWPVLQRVLPAPLVDLRPPLRVLFLRHLLDERGQDGAAVAHDGHVRDEIGRASCRERVERSVGAGSSTRTLDTRESVEN